MVLLVTWLKYNTSDLGSFYQLWNKCAISFCVRHIFTRIVKPQFEVGWGKNTSATRPSQFSLRSQFLKENVLNRHGPGRVKQNKALNKAGVSCFREQCVVAVVPTMSIAIVGVTSPSPQKAALTVASVHLAGLQQTHLSHNRPHPLFGKKNPFPFRWVFNILSCIFCCGCCCGKEEEEGRHHRVGLSPRICSLIP